MSDDDMSMIPYNGGSNMDVVLYVFVLPSTALELALITAHLQAAQRLRGGV